MIKLYFESTIAYITSLLQYFTGEANILNGSPKWRRSRDVYRTSAGLNQKTFSFLKNSGRTLNILRYSKLHGEW